MTVKEIVSSSAAILQADDVESILEAEDAADDADVKTLVKSVNLAASEIRGDGLGETETADETDARDVALDGELILPRGVTRDDVTYLAARNYCLITGRTDEAAIWDQRYCAEAEKKRMRRRAKLPQRRWI